jgi:endonuclease YncB( thermonuclease family)
MLCIFRYSMGVAAGVQACLLLLRTLRWRVLGYCWLIAMPRHWMSILAGLFATAAVFENFIATAQESSRPCGAGEIGRGMVSHVVDGRSFVLDDGREVRLAAIEVPPLPAALETNVGPGSAAARNALDALAGGDEVLLQRADSLSDRYGRIVAYAYTLRDGDTLFVQGELIASGFARVGDRVGSRACAAELLNREKAAREAKLGLWAEPGYQVFDARMPANVLTQRGRFAVVEGDVDSVRQSGATIYLNFGRHWSEDFTVTVQKRNERLFTAAGLDVMRLGGSRIRVRGFVEARGANGASPWIAVERPEQIETVARE